MTQVANSKVVGRPSRPKAQAPDIDIVEEVYKDDRRMTMDMAMKMCRAKELGLHGCYRSAKEDIDYTKALGYIPAKNPNTKEQFKHKGDLIWMIDEKEEIRHRNAPAQLAKEMAEGAFHGTDDKYGTRDAEGGRHALEPMGD